MAAKLSQIIPIFPVPNLARAVAHYRSLGFQVSTYFDGDEYGFAFRDGTELHLMVSAAHDPKTGCGMVYLYTDDVESLVAEWSRPGIGGETRLRALSADGKIRNATHFDPDGNLIMFGSPAVRPTSVPT